MLLAALGRASLFPTILRNACHTQPVYYCHRSYAQLGSSRSRVFLRFASVKSDVPPPPKAPRKSRKAPEKPLPDTVKVSRSTKKSIPSSIEKGAPSLVMKGASVLSNGVPTDNIDQIAKPTPASKSPPQKTPVATSSVLDAAIPPEIPAAETGSASNPLVEHIEANQTAESYATQTLPQPPSFVASNPPSPSELVEPILVESDAKQTPPPPPSSVGVWLMISSVLVLVVVVVGGITRLTESGLSITKWRPITGIMPPLSNEAWEEEFSMYKATPEFKMLNHSMSLDDFKRIYYMEWGHRVLGRLLGIVFLGPFAYFTLTKKISPPLARKLGGLGLLIGAQGALGWYMVRSGLDESVLETPGAVPRVSHYRLAAHLAMAFALYIGMFTTGMSIIKDRKFVRTGNSGGLPVASFTAAMNNPVVKRFKSYSWVLTGLVLLTALSGVFVAGLDAGLVYNEWPLMGGRLAPPTDELFSPAYAKSETKSDLWRNIFDNPTTVQFDHRVLATTTYAGIALLFAQTFRPAWRSIIPPLAITSARAAFAMANLQVLLGISTLIYMVPVPLAAAHQGGSILLLSAMLQLIIALRKPSTAARAWRNLMGAKKGPVN